METVTKRTKLVRVVMYVLVVLAIVSLWSNSLEYQLLSQMEKGAIPEEALMSAADENDGRQQLVAIAYMLAYVASIILVARWIMSANRHARENGVQGMEYTPGWAVGWYFIPIAHLWKPYLAMKEIWKASDPAERWQETTVPWFFAVWWLLWISSNLLGQVAFRLSMSAEEIPELLELSILFQISDVLEIPLALALLAIVNDVHSRQVAAGRADQLP